MSRESRLLSEELLGAELVAGKELTEAAGGFWDALEKCAAIQQQQWRWYVDDWNDFWTTPLREPSADLPSAIGELIERRSRHVGTGVRDLAELVKKETDPLRKIWSDYLGVVRRDWNE